MDKNRVISDTMFSLKYYELLEEWRAGDITDKEWIDFCMNTLEALMDVYADVLDRLKHA